jgi:hypothetical protein
VAGERAAADGPELARAALAADAAGAVGERREVAAVAGSAAEEAVGGPGAERLSGQVVDSAGRPFAGARVAWVPFDLATRSCGGADSVARSESGPDGRFTVPMPLPLSVPVAVDGLTTLRTTVCGGGRAREEVLVVAAPAVTVSGQVRGADGQALAGAKGRADTLQLRDFPRALETTVVLELPQATADERGDFQWPQVPLADGVDLVFTHPGCVPARIPSRDAAGGRLDVVLAPLGGGADRISGRVRDAAGPVGGASLQLGFDQATESDAQGRFEFAAPRQPARLLALRRGWQPVVLEGIERGRRDLEVAFTAPALTITGTVRGALGPPRPGCRIVLADPIRVADYGSAELFCSDLDAALATSDAEGRFAIGGLAQRSYQLLVVDTATGAAFTSEPIAAGSQDVVVAVPGDAVVEVLRGQVVDRRGLPVAGAVAHVYLALPGAEGVLPGATATTGDDGWFELRGVSRRIAQLGVGKAGWRFVARSVASAAANGLPLRIELERMCAVQVEGAAGLAVAFLGADGGLLAAETHSEGMVLSSSAIELRNGRSPVVTLPESTATMVWSRDRQELGRRAVLLDATPGAVNLLQIGL